MNRALGVTEYCLRRQWRKLPIYLTILLVLAAATALIALNYGRTISMEYVNGGYTVGPSYAGAGMSSDSSSFTGSFLYEMYVYVTAILLIRRERRFMLTMSVTRHEYLVGSYLALLALAVIMTVAVWLTSLIGYAGLWALGYRMSASITPANLLAGNWTMLATVFSSMAFGAGLMTLVGYLFARWWKILLPVMGAMIAALVLIITQMNISTNAAMVIEWLSKIVTWAFDVAWPVVRRYFWETSPLVMVLRNMALGVGAVILSYPVMRGMKIVK